MPTSGPMQFVTSLSALGTTPALSSRVDTRYYDEYRLPQLRALVAKHGLESLADCVQSFHSGAYVPKRAYSELPTHYVYVSVADFGAQADVDETGVYISDSVGSALKDLALQDGDLVVTRSGTVGAWRIFTKPDPDVEYIPSHHLTVTRVLNPELEKFLLYYLNSRLVRSYVEAYSTGKGQKEVSNWSLERIPIPTSLPFGSINKRIREIEQKVAQLEGRCLSTQTIVGEELVAHGLKDPYSRRAGTLEFVSSLVDISDNPVLRMGAQYRSFYEVLHARLFDPGRTSSRLIKLGDVLEPYPAKICRKGFLPRPRLLIELEQIDSGTGQLNNTDNVVEKIGSDKIEFGDCDLLISKLRPYLAYVILNDPDKEFLGTTELLPFAVQGHDALVSSYVQALLLSDEAIERCSCLMYGKQHPRMDQRDLLSMLIPWPKKAAMRSFVGAVRRRLAADRSLRQNISRQRAKIDDIIEESLI